MIGYKIKKYEIKKKVFKDSSQRSVKKTKSIKEGDKKKNEKDSRFDSIFNIYHCIGFS